MGTGCPRRVADQLRPVDRARSGNRGPQPHRGPRPAFAAAAPVRGGGAAHSARDRDAARTGRIANLIAGEQPAALRRESFRDAPLPRMTNLLIEQVHAPLEMPKRCVEIHLVAGGAYEPLTEMVTIHVAVSSIGPFTIRASRRTISRSLIGAAGNPIRYP